MNYRALAALFLLAIKAGVAFGQSTRESLQLAERPLTEAEIARMGALPDALKLSLPETDLTLAVFGTRVQIIDGHQLIAFGDFPQYRGGLIEEVSVSSSGASAFVNGRSNDFLIVLEDKASGSALEAFRLSPDPLVYREPCSWWRSMWNECDFAQWEFEPTRDQMTVQGYLAGSREQVEMTIR